MSNQELESGLFFQSEDQENNENQPTGSTAVTANYIIPDQLRSHLQNAPTFSDISDFSSSLPLVRRSEEEIMLPYGFEKGQSSGAMSKRKNASDDSMEIQISRESDEDGEDEESARSEECKQQKRTRSNEMHNLTEKLRRQKLRGKMRTLQELIPNCDKKDQASILNDAIKYIKTLQYQFQMMSMGAGCTMFHPPFMMPQPGQQGPQILTIPPFLHTGPRAGPGMGYGMGMEMPDMPSSFDFPMNQIGLPSAPCLLASATSGSELAATVGISAAQIPGNSTYWAPCYGTRFPSSGSQWMTQGETSSSQGSPSREESMRGGSTARVMPSQIVLPYVVEEVKDQGSTHSGSSEWVWSPSAESEDSSSRTRKQ